MKTLVLGGGGARGALQVGALRALLEAELTFDLLVGTSIGAANASFLARHGYSARALNDLEVFWHDAAQADLLPANYLWLTVRTLFNRVGPVVENQVRDFAIAHGLGADLRFRDLPGPRLILVAADLKGGCPRLFGEDPDDLVLDGLLASAAIPPWIRPIAQEDYLLMDGGLVSNLPIEPALAQGATEILALDVLDSRPAGPVAGGLGPFFFHLRYTVQQRHLQLEKRLADLSGVPVHHVRLLPESPVAVWDFPQAPPLIQRGYEGMRDYLAEHPDMASKS
jgi:NTE family protein